MAEGTYQQATCEQQRCCTVADISLITARERNFTKS